MRPIWHCNNIANPKQHATHTAVKSFSKCFLVHCICWEKKYLEVFCERTFRNTFTSVLRKFLSYEVFLVPRSATNLKFVFQSKCPGYEMVALRSGPKINSMVSPAENFSVIGIHRTSMPKRSLIHKKLVQADAKHCMGFLEQPSCLSLRVWLRSQDTKNFARYNSWKNLNFQIVLASLLPFVNLSNCFRN